MRIVPQPALFSLETKRCTKCRKDLPIEMFRKDVRRPRDGRKNRCRACASAAWRLRYLSDETFREQVRKESKRRQQVAFDYYKGKCKEYRLRDPIRHMLYDAKRHSKDVGREFAIDKPFVECLLRTQQGRCALTRVEFEETGQFRMSVDRIDSSRGYTPDNVHLVLWVINRMKTDLSVELFTALCGLVAIAESVARRGK